MTDEPKSDEPKPDAPKPDDDAWIEKVVNVAGHLGFNKMRLRWKLLRWQDNRRKAANLREQRKLHIGYEHKTCSECGAVQDKDEAVCTSCGKKLGSRGLQVLGRLGLTSPKAFSVSTLLAIAMLIVYARVWVAQGGGFKAPSGALLVDFGGRWPPLMQDEPWRLLTSVFLHAGLWHLAFNLIAIATIGPRIEELYGRATTAGLFIITGIIANLGALQVGRLAVGIGASGAVMGLIGAAVGYGHRAGRGRGHGLRDDMLKWCAYTFIFGFAVGADNWAHLFGALAGAVFGIAVRPALLFRRALIPVRILFGLVGAAGSIGALVLVLTRHPSPVEEPTDAAFEDATVTTRLVTSYSNMCLPLYANNVAAALAAANEMAGDFALEGQKIDQATVEAMCDGIQQMRALCAKTATMERETREQYEQMCKMYAPLFAALPVRAPTVPLEVPAPAPPVDAAQPD